RATPTRPPPKASALHSCTLGSPAATAPTTGIQPSFPSRLSRRPGESSPRGPGMTTRQPPSARVGSSCDVTSAPTPAPTSASPALGQARDRKGSPEPPSVASPEHRHGRRLLGLAPLGQDSGSGTAHDRLGTSHAAHGVQHAFGLHVPLGADEDESEVGVVEA